jgi:transcriptional regulator with XRE-family HTH domain
VSPTKLSRVIKTLRQEKGLSQKALAEQVSVTDAYITMLESGKRKNPSLDILKKLAKALGGPLTELLG